MTREESLYSKFLEQFSFEPTDCQDALFKTVAGFVTSDEGDILVVNGYAGTGKTSALASIINALTGLKVRCELMAPTGRAAKVFSHFANRPAYTIHKKIYRQQSVGADGYGQFSLLPNKLKDALLVVDEASLIGIDAPLQQGSSLFGSGNLLGDLVAFVRSGQDCKLILVGDSAQLPPVGMDESPALSKDFMEEFGGVSFCSLTTVVRQAEGSGILQNATMLRSNPDCVALKFKLDGFDDVERVDGSSLVEKLTDAYSQYGEDETIVLCRSNKRAIRYNLGIRSMVQFKEDRLLRSDKLMIVKNCYQFLKEDSRMGYMANGDIAELVRVSGFEDRYGLHFADAVISFPDYDDETVNAKICLDTLESESASLTYEQQNALYQGVSEDYSHIKGKRKRYEAVREDKYYNALQIKYAQAVTCHKSQGGQWRCVFIDFPFWKDEITSDDIRWMYTALTRATDKVYFVNFPDSFFV
ncbi:MAG: AAA family ATPase [Bacteroidales bacterium]|nr:AAA family ATPase [Bacteroidales bacterium]